MSTGLIFLNLAFAYLIIINENSMKKCDILVLKYNHKN